MSPGLTILLIRMGLPESSAFFKDFGRVHISRSKSKDGAAGYFIAKNERLAFIATNQQAIMPILVTLT
jgi:hypothetical protein